MENFRRAFAGFDFHLVAEFTEADVNQLLQGPGIIRHRGTIEAVVNNACRAVDLAHQDGPLAAFLWRSKPARTRSTRRRRSPPHRPRSP
ncbi:DNA-3-methyladenine glycosylase I [Streptomyces sp. NPDC090445]|uniref:DNA-3-methyladenine glycosylase I n=1 Tax=Streptomyces sp. NPDC090445 TaxID=3365963 RepID=UPI00380545E8